VGKKLLFVHGTGVRKVGYDDSVAKIRRRLEAAGFDIELAECRWGESYGIGSETCLSVPRYSDTGGTRGLSEADYMWNVLLHDPTVEMQQLALAERRPAPVGTDDRERVQHRHILLASDVPPCFAEDGLAGYIVHAVDEVQADYARLLKDVDGLLDTTELGIAMARATVARLYRIASELGERVPGIERRRVLIEAVEHQLSGESRGLASALKVTLAPILTPFITSYRGLLTDLLRNQLGDILRYQARGDEIRGFIAERLRALESDEVVILAHSLGGIASLEAIIEHKPCNVKSFVTFGSQAPLLYELGALSKLPPGAPLPKQVPKWLNFYDLNDPLSYLAGNLFPSRVEDHQINSGSDFVGAHSAYLDSDRMWALLAEYLK
jgi:hypothetical protein